MGRFSSLSGFVSDMWNIGEVVTLDIDKTHMECSCKGVIKTKDSLDILDINEWSNLLNDLNNRLQDGKYMPLIAETCRNAMKDNWELFNMSGLIHLDKKLPKTVGRMILNRNNPQILLNMFRCESLRWTIERGLQLTLK